MVTGVGGVPPPHDKGGPSGGHWLGMRRPPGKAAQRQSLLAAGDTVRLSYACHVVLKTQPERLSRVICKQDVSQGGDAGGAAGSLISGPHSGTAYRGPPCAMAAATAPRSCCCCLKSPGVKGAGTAEGSVGTGAGQGEAGLRHPRVGGKLWGFLEKLRNALLFLGRRVAGLKVCSQVFLPWTGSHGLGRVQHSREAEPAPQVLPGWHCCPPCLAVPRPRAFLWVSIEDFQTGSACTCTPHADGWQWFVSWLGCAVLLLSCCRLGVCTCGTPG